jgi:hypothetical protein
VSVYKLPCCHSRENGNPVISTGSVPPLAGLLPQESSFLIVPCLRRDGVWIPACAGMTNKETFQRTEVLWDFKSEIGNLKF